MHVYELLSVAMVLLLGLLGGKVFHRLKIPRVTGYMLVGLVIGPSVLGLISYGTLKDIHMINDIALGLILFAIGGEIELNHLKAMGKKVIFMALAESLGAFVLVSLVSFAITGNFGLSVLLGAIGIATAPGVTLMVIREYSARGPLTETLLAMVAINNVICLIVFRIFFAGYSLAHGDALLPVLLDLSKELVLSVIIGGAIAGMIAYWEQKIDDLSELLLVIVGGLLLGIGAAKTIGISYLMICLIIGAIINNISMMHRLIYAELRQTEMPFYIVFFVLSGASLHLDVLWTLGPLGLAYLFIRPAGKALGSYIAGKKYGAELKVRNNIGLGLLPQAGVAIGLAITVAEKNPELGEIISAVILSSVVIYESVGPLLTKIALGRAGEIHLQE
ncbi:MAG: cation:proton antiporter [candidate division Zixibacteria bacterium]